TSSPGPTPRTFMPIVRAAVQEPAQRACATPVYASIIRSNRSTLGPVPIQPDRSESATSAISSSPMSGLPKTRNSSRTWRPRRREFGECTLDVAGICHLEIERPRIPQAAAQAARLDEGAPKRELQGGDHPEGDGAAASHANKLSVPASERSKPPGIGVPLQLRRNRPSPEPAFASARRAFRTARL